MNCTSLTSFALSKKVFLVNNIYDLEGASLEELLMNLDVEQVTVPTLIQYTLMSYGMSLTQEAFYSLCMDELTNQIAKAVDTKEYLTELFGDFGTFDTLFGNYPETVLNMSEFNMAVHTLLQYYTDGAYFPKDFNFSSVIDAEDSSLNWGLCIKEKYEMIDAVDMSGLGEIIKTMLTAEQSLTAFDKEHLDFILKNISSYPDIKNVLDTIENIPFKETLCYCIDTLGYQPKDITDVLRYATYLSGGDVSLPTIPTTESDGWRTFTADKKKYNFKKFSRPERKKILGMIENIFNTANNYKENNMLADMKKHLMRWVRLGEIVHPSEYQNQFAKTAKAFDTLRNHAKEIKTWGSFVDDARQNYDFDKLMALYSSKPGEFARALDSLVRLFGEDDEILVAFKNIISKISTKLCYELAEHFFKRNTKYTRTISVKGSKEVIELGGLEPMSTEYTHKILTILISELVTRFSEKDSLEGYTYFISNNVEKITVPTNMRTASTSNKQVPRGTRIALPENQDLIRLYVHWIDEYGNQDLDLSATFVGEKQEKTISWNSNFKLRDGQTYAIFSGDVRHHKGNCAEYIDFSIEGAKAAGWKYVVALASDFDGKGFENSYAGFMAQETFGEIGGRTWAPETVENEIKISSKCQKIVMGIIDLESREYIIVDEDIDGIPVATSCGMKNYYKKLVARYTENKFWNVSKVLNLNLKARKANIIECTPAQFDEYKMSIEKEIESAKVLKKTLEETLALPEESLNQFFFTKEEMEEKLDYTTQRLEKLEKNVFISFDDMISNYTSILQYMF